MAITTSVEFVILTDCARGGLSLGHGSRQEGAEEGDGEGHLSFGACGIDLEHELVSVGGGAALAKLEWRMRASQVCVRLTHWR